jgi:hypothetical protein
MIGALQLSDFTTRISTYSEFENPKSKLRIHSRAQDIAKHGKTKSAMKNIFAAAIAALTLTLLGACAQREQPVTTTTTETHEVQAVPTVPAATTTTTEEVHTY